MTPAPLVRHGQLEMAVALQQSALSLVLRLDDQMRATVISRSARPGCRAGTSRIFPGTADQVRAVREFARNGLAGHRARDDAVAVASELAANSIRHSASGRDDGIFMVHLSELDACDVAIIVTDQGGPGCPRELSVGADAESGRGLQVVKSLASMLEVFEYGGGMRSVLAVIPGAQL